MKIKLRSAAAPLSYDATNERGQTVRFSGGTEGVRPMETVLMAAAACSAIDVERFLEKLRAPAERVEVEAEGRRVDAVPSVFEAIHLRYRIFGDVADAKAAKAVGMSMERYCSVTTMLKPTVDVTWEYEVAQATETSA